MVGFWGLSKTFNDNMKEDSQLFFSYNINQMPSDLNELIQITPNQFYENSITGIEMKEQFYSNNAGNSIQSIIIVHCKCVYTGCT